MVSPVMKCRSGVRGTYRGNPKEHNYRESGGGRIWREGRNGGKVPDRCSLKEQRVRWMKRMCQSNCYASNNQ